MSPAHLTTSPSSRDSSPAASVDFHDRKKRYQVKKACSNCQASCKGCDISRPCQRCIRTGNEATCVDAPRKTREKGVKRGPYKKKDGGSVTMPNSLVKKMAAWMKLPETTRGPQPKEWADFLTRDCKESEESAVNISPSRSDETRETTTSPSPRAPRTLYPEPPPDSFSMYPPPPPTDLPKQVDECPSRPCTNTDDDHLPLPVPTGRGMYPAPPPPSQEPLLSLTSSLPSCARNQIQHSLSDENATCPSSPVSGIGEDLFRLHDEIELPVVLRSELDPLASFTASPFNLRESGDSSLIDVIPSYTALPTFPDLSVGDLLAQLQTSGLPPPDDAMFSFGVVPTLEPTPSTATDTDPSTTTNIDPPPSITSTVTPMSIQKSITPSLASGPQALARLIASPWSSSSSTTAKKRVRTPSSSVALEGTRTKPPKMRRKFSGETGTGTTAATEDAAFDAYITC